VEEADEVVGSDKHTLLVKKCLFEQIDWEAFKHEMLSFLRAGFSLFEVVNNVVEDEELGTINGLAALAFRSPKTIENWQIEPQTGKLLSVNQYIYGDTGSSATLPGEFLLVFSHLKEGDNYEGISALRPMYGAWYRKNLYMKLAAIGIEKYAVGTPIGTVPAGKEKTPEFDNFKKTLASYTSHECAYITVPQGWAINIQKDEFDAAKIKEMILLENTEMINSVTANFLALGMHGSGGAYSLGNDLSDFFLSGIQSYADLACGVINRLLIPRLVRLNFGPQKKYPMLRCTGINDKAGKEFAEIINLLAGSKPIKPDDKLEEFLRKTYKLPTIDAATTRADAPPPGMPGDPNAPQPPQPGGAPKPQAPAPKEDALKLSEKFVKAFDANKETLQQTMQDGLTSMANALKEQIRKQWNSTPAAQRLKIGANLVAPGVSQYKSALKEVFAQIAYDAIEAARKEVPAAKNVKLAEAPRGGYYNALPTQVRRIIDTQAQLVGDTQAADLEKMVGFQYTSSEASTDNIDTVLNDIDQRVMPVVQGDSNKGMSLDVASTDAVATVTNQARMQFFFDPEVIDEIESFTLTNEDPISQICQELVGTTLAPGDPDLDRYSTPLHHNCKSRWVPNLVGDKSNPEIDTGGLSLSRAALDSITLREPNYHAVFHYPG
jgi:hypothetical protein